MEPCCVEVGTNMSPIDLHPPHALLVGFEITRETALALFARSRNVKVDQLSKSEVAKVVVNILREARKKGIPVGATGEPLETYPDGSRTADTTHLIFVSRQISLQKCDGAIPSVEEGPREALVRGYLASQGA